MCPPLGIVKPWMSAGVLWAHRSIGAGPYGLTQAPTPRGIAIGILVVTPEPGSPSRTVFRWDGGPLAYISPDRHNTDAKVSYCTFRGERPQNQPPQNTDKKYRLSPLLPGRAAQRLRKRINGMQCRDALPVSFATWRSTFKVRSWAAPPIQLRDHPERFEGLVAVIGAMTRYACRRLPICCVNPVI